MTHVTHRRASSLSTNLHLSSDTSQVHLKYAMWLEDEGRFKEAEAEFLKADKPKEAIDMYVHQQDWAAALHIAEGFDPASIGDITMAQVREESSVSVRGLGRCGYAHG